MPRIRHCVECPTCHTRYLIAFSPYRNGSYLVRMGGDSTEEYTLYCFCEGAHKASVCRWPEVQACRVSKPAHVRGYGSREEIRPLGRSLHHDLSFNVSRYISMRQM